MGAGRGERRWMRVGIEEGGDGSGVRMGGGEK